jgi:hypothetical protein
MKRIEKLWIEYCDHLVPLGASTVQLRETKKAFYAGAQSLLAEIVTMLDPGLEPTEADIKKMDDIALELTAFIDDVRAGRA